MAISKEDILKSISEMSVIDVCDLVKMIEKKFGVTAQPTMMASQSNDDSPSKSQETEKTEFTVVLVAGGSNKISTIKAVRSVTSLGLKEAKDAVENLPFTIKEGVSKDEAEDIKQKLEKSGSKIELK